MARLPKSKYSIMARLLINSMITSVITGIILVAAIVFSGVFERPDKTASRNLSKVVQTRANEINNMFISLSRNALSLKRECESKVNKEYQQIVVSEMLAENPEEAFKILDFGTEAILNMWNLSVATDIFIVLDRSAYNLQDDNRRAAVYIRVEGLNALSSEDKQSLILLKGRKIDGIAYDNYWSEEWSFNSFEGFSEDFFTKPYRAAKDIKHLKDLELGYFSSPSSAVNDNMKAVYYTLPLTDMYGEPYGVVGFGLSEKYIKSKLDFIELNYYSNSFYMISKIEGDGIYNNSIVNGYYAAQYAQEGNALKLGEKYDIDYGENIYGLKSENGNNIPVISAAFPLNMYYRNSPFYNEKWQVVGAVKRADIFESSEFLKSVLLIDIAVTLILGMFLALLLVRGITNPLVRLTESVNMMENEYKISLERTGIKEFDILADSIEGMSKSLSNTANVMMNTIKLTDSNIGIFEIDEKKERVFMTELIFGLFGFPYYEGEYYITLEAWEENYSKLFLRVDDSEKLDNIFKTADDRWFQMRCTVVNGNECGVIMDITKDILEKKKLEQERDYDFLTGLLNRGGFKERCERLINSKLKGVGLMIFIDLDNLKFFNDTYGHECGDMYIKGAADIFRRFKAHGALVSRLSGDEFVIFLYGKESQEDALDILQRYFDNKEFHSFTIPDGSEQKIRYSAGYAWYPDDADTYALLIKYADFAMYEIKHSNKGGRKAFDRESYEMDSYLLEKSESLNLLIENDMVKYMFQPIVDLKTGEILGYEALMRSNNDDLKSLTRIFKLAKYQAKLYQLEKLTYYNVLKWVDDNKDRLHGKLIFFNSIPNQKLSDEDMKKFDDAFIDCYKHTVMEFMKYEIGAETHLETKKIEAHKRGAMIALDDFNNDSRESLEALRSRPDFIKINIALIKNIYKDANKQVILSDILNHYENLDVKLIAIGVESREDLEYLCSSGIDYAQGFYLSKPTEDIVDDISEAVKNEIIKFSKFN